MTWKRIRPWRLHRARSARALSAVAVLLAVAVGGGGASSERWNVLVILVDTLRADHLSLSGYDRQTSPALDALGEESCVFPNT